MIAFIRPLPPVSERMNKNLTAILLIIFLIGVAYNGQKRKEPMAWVDVRLREEAPNPTPCPTPTKEDRDLDAGGSNGEGVPVSEERTGKRGKASWYCEGFEGNKTASGEIYDCGLLTTAHNQLPFGTYVRVSNLANNKSVVVKVNNRGGFNALGREFDLSEHAFSEIASLSEGVIDVSWEKIDD